MPTTLELPPVSDEFTKKLDKVDRREEHDRTYEPAEAEPEDYVSPLVHLSPEDIASMTAAEAVDESHVRAEDHAKQTKWDRRLERAGIAERLAQEARLTQVLEGLADQEIASHERTALLNDLAALMLRQAGEVPEPVVTVDYVAEEPIGAELN